jgi:hypothetical protein
VGQVVEAKQKLLYRLFSDRLPSQDGEGTREDTLIVEEPLKGLIYVVRELIFLLLSIVKNPAPVLVHLKLDAQISTSSTDVVLRFHQCV